MLTVVKNQLKVSALSIKYGLMKEMVNKITFLSNIFFMILNNTCMLIQWIVLYSLKSDIGGYSFKQILLLWGFAAGSYGISRFFFSNAFNLASTITNGKLDAYLVQPKNVLLATITSSVTVSALADILYAYIMYVLHGFTLKGLLLFTFFIITGGLILTAISIILNSFSFWFTNTEAFADIGNALMNNFDTYPEGIFKGITKWLLFTIIPVGIVTYLPVKLMSQFQLHLFFLCLGATCLFIFLAFFFFYKGLKRYSGSNLMQARL